ncbi:MAG: serine/threonine protein kinase, partial [Planctomycetes bacterium]|nr:serine/threonine protein kinase [Planctomycetota bacterium]
LRDAGPLSEDEFRRILAQVASALQYAHAAGVVHRDVKPSNVFINCDGGVMLMDFGLAQPVVDTHPALAGLMVGTPRYMAPEQISGGAIGPEADYYSLGCSAFEMLTGRPLFPENDMVDILRRHADWQVPDVRRERPDVSDEVAELIAGCLQRDAPCRRLDYDRIAGWSSGDGSIPARSTTAGETPT